MQQIQIQLGAKTTKRDYLANQPGDLVWNPRTHKYEYGG